MKEQEISEQELQQRFNPEGSLLRRHQLRMIELLVEFDKICRKHHISYWLIGGTLLGAVRHKAFIPWDDDLDVQMLRKDYNKLINILKAELPDTMAIQSKETDSNYFFQYAKLRDRRSVLHETNGYDRIFKEQGIYIDIFPIDKHSKWMHRFSEKAIGHIYKILRTQDVENATNYCKIMLISNLCHYALFPFMRFVSKFLPGVYLDAFGVPFLVERDLNDIFPLKEIAFEGLMMPVPCNYQKVLTNQYGDYMKLPDLQNIAVHVGNVTIKD